MAQRSLIMTGEAGQPDYFTFRSLRFDHSGRYSPRHRHNFAQYYYVLEGEVTFASARLTPGWLGYMPEGVFYGPQSGGSHLLLLLQHGGPSGQGLIADDQQSQAFEALKTTGVFEKGIYRPKVENESGRAQDSYEAIWEHVRQRQLVYPRAQYSDPITMDTNAFPWIALADQPDVQRRVYGAFTSCSYGPAGYKLAADAKLRLGGRGVYFVLEGAGSVGGHCYRKQTAIYLGDGEVETFEAAAATEILCLGLPKLASMARLA